MSMRFIGRMALAVSLLVVCGRQDEASAQPPQAPPASGISQPAVSPDVPSFEQGLLKLDEMEQDALFSEAIQLCRTLKDNSKDQDQQTTLNGIMRRLTDEKKAAAPLLSAIKYLSSGNPEHREVADEKFLNAGETGRIFLRKAVREEQAATAMAAAKMLIDQTAERADEKTLSVFAAQILKRQSAPLAELMADHLKARISEVPAHLLVALHGAMLADTNFAHREGVGILVAALDSRCQQAVEPYNRLVGAPDGFEKLRATVERALLSTDTQMVAWVCQHGGSLVGCFKAVIGRYYSDTEFKDLALERTDSQIAVENRQFPFPDGRQNNISARWSGYLEVPNAGHYTFYALADSRCVVSVNTQTVLTCEGWTETSASIALPAGRIPFNVDYMQAGGNARLSVAWSGPNLPKQVLGGGFFRTPPWKEAVLPLRPAIRDLVSTNWAVVRAAKATLAWSGEPGDIYLRDALRNESDAVALRAAELLAARGDRRACALLIQRIEKTPASPLMPALTTVLCEMAPLFDPQQIRHLYEAVQKDADCAMIPHAAALCAVLHRVYGDNQNRFNETVQDPKGYEQLSLYVQRALTSAKNEVVYRACEYGTPFAPFLSGLRGRYFIGQQFDQPVAERLDASLNLPPGQFPVPADRQNDLSARWTGALLVSQPGTYVLLMQYVHNQARLWIDGKAIALQQGPGQQGYTCTLDLSAGAHPICVECQNGGGNNLISLSWRGPGIAQPTVIPADSLRTPAWPGELEKLKGVVAGLASTNAQQAASATNAIKAYGAVGDLFRQRGRR